MRKMIVLRGAPGSGKSSTIRGLGLEDYAISADALRLLFSSPIITSSGSMGVDQADGRKIWGLLNSVLDERTKKGDFLIIDATNTKRGDFMQLYNLAKRRLYEVACIDFSSQPLERTLQQNLNRPEHRIVPDPVVREMHDSMLSWDLPGDISRFKWDEDDRHLVQIKRWLTVPLRNYSAYNSIVHIGDIHGCFQALAGETGLLKDGLRDDTRYIFTGDLLDRGPENGRTLRWILDNALPARNVDILWGNHENHLINWAYEEEVLSPEFRDHTLPQLEEAGVTRREAQLLSRRLQECLFYRWNDHRVMVSHGGLSNVPEDPVLISGRQFTHGTGCYSDPVDAQFEANAPDGWHQVHGHRNSNYYPVSASRKSFNLEGAVEHGGHLRALRLDADGFHPIEMRNRHYRPFTARVRKSSRTPVPAWALSDDDRGLYMPVEKLEQLRSHHILDKPAIRFRSSERFPHVVSINFSKHVFYKQGWDDVVVKARGLFINEQTREIVARSYDKFFNVGEREETDPEALSHTLSFPVQAYTKENGFLGILGYDSHTDELFFASKSTPDGDFADLFREIAERQMSAPKLDALRRYLRDTQSSMVFEVIDPVNDPHIISYDEPKIVLLDLVRRSTDTQRMPFKDLQKLAKEFDLHCKEHAFTLKDESQLLGYLKSAEKEGLDAPNLIEGYVMEDEEGRCFKVKLFHYAFWKDMRGLKEKVRVSLKKGASPDRIQPIYDGGFKEKVWSQPIAHEFLSWCKQRTETELEADIITLKTQFQAYRNHHELENKEENTRRLSPQ